MRDPQKGNVGILFVLGFLLRFICTLLLLAVFVKVENHGHIHIPILPQILLAAVLAGFWLYKTGILPAETMTIRRLKILGRWVPVGNGKYTIGGSGILPVLKGIIEWDSFPAAVFQIKLGEGDSGPFRLLLGSLSGEFFTAFAKITLSGWFGNEIRLTYENEQSARDKVIAALVGATRDHTIRLNAGGPISKPSEIINRREEVEEALRIELLDPNSVIYQRLAESGYFTTNIALRELAPEDAIRKAGAEKVESELEAAGQAVITETLAKSTKEYRKALGKGPFSSVVAGAMAILGRALSIGTPLSKKGNKKGGDEE